MMKLNKATKPSRLITGDVISSIAVSSAIDDYESIKEGINLFESWGLRFETNSQLSKRWGYFAGDDKARYKNLNCKKEFPLTVSIKGGWGSARLLELSPKWQKGWFLGYSDITSLLLSRLSAGFDGCIHGPMLNSISKEPEWSKERLKSILFGGHIPDLYGEVFNKGISKGPLVVANLTVASHLIGTSHMPDLNGAILVLEDINEAPYRIDRMLTQWRLAGILDKIAGLCFGTFIDCEDSNEIPKINTFQLQEILKDRVKDLNIPIISNLPVGHCKGNASLPLGREALINGNKGILKVIYD